MAYSVNSSRFDVIVVGAGVMGSSAAYQLAKRGQKTLLLEQFDFLHHRGSSHGESRTIRGTYPEDYYYSMVSESAQLWAQAQSEIGYKVYYPTHHFDMGLSDQPSLLSVIETCRKHNLAHRVMDSKAVSEYFSGRISIPENWTGVSTELGGIIKPTKAVSMFQTLAFRYGCVLRDNTKVANIERDGENGGVIVRTVKGEIFRGKKCIVTAGAWISKLVKTVARIDLPVEPVETSVCYWRIKEGHEDKFALEGDFPSFASYGAPYIYGTPTLEYPGLLKTGVHGGLQCDPDKRPWGPGFKLEELKEWIKERFGGLVEWEGGPVATQLCMYSMTPDEDFIIDFLGGELGKDVVVGGGFSGHGFKMAPSVGRILADMVTVGEVQGGVEMKQFSLRRFEGNPKGNAKKHPDQVILGCRPQLKSKY